MQNQHPSLNRQDKSRTKATKTQLTLLCFQAIKTIVCSAGETGFAGDVERIEHGP
jgi:hypothetical protein